MIDCCDCILYRHGIIICQHCFVTKGKRCQDVPGLLRKSVNCTYKVRFLKNGLTSFSEFCDWVKDLKVPHKIIRRSSPQQSEAPNRNENGLDLQRGHSSSAPTHPDPLTQDLGSGRDQVRMGRMVGTTGAKHKLDIAPEPTRRSKRLQTTLNK